MLTSIDGKMNARGWLSMAEVLVTLLWLPRATRAQENQFGAQDRADAAKRMIVLAVQQAISSLPPTSAQSYTYEFDPRVDAVLRSEQLGPTAFRSPKPIGKGRFSLRLAASCFELGDSFGPTDYRADGPQAEDQLRKNGRDPMQGLLTRFGVKASASVGLINLSGTYGIASNLDFTVTMPIAIVDAHASEVFIENPDMPGKAVGVPLNTPALLSKPCPASRSPGSCLLDEYLADKTYHVASREFSKIRLDFPDGTHAGVGRISVGSRLAFYRGDRIQLAFMPELFFPSPNEAELAGSASFAILPRAVAAIKASEWARIHIDAGYDYDFHYTELQRFVWNTGASIPLRNADFDLGVGGAEYAEGITWTPDHATFKDDMQRINTISALGSNRLGTTFVDFIGGLKVRVAGETVISGAVTVPLNGEGFRPDALGTVAVEQYF